MNIEDLQPRISQEEGRHCFGDISQRFSVDVVVSECGHNFRSLFRLGFNSEFPACFSGSLSHERETQADPLRRPRGKEWISCPLACLLIHAHSIILDFNQQTIRLRLFPDRDLNLLSLRRDRILYKVQYVEREIFQSRLSVHSKTLLPSCW